MTNSHLPSFFSHPAVQQPVPEHEGAAIYFIGRATELVNGLNQLAGALEAEHPASARHLRLLAQQYAAIAVTAVTGWPKEEHREL